MNNPIEQITQACAEISHIVNTELIRLSGLYRSLPLGPQDQPDYINAVAKIATTLEPQALLTRLKALERAHGRTSTEMRWGPRPLDLDILLYDQLIASNDALTIPHPGLFERAFVLYPLREIEPDQFNIPGYGYLGSLINNCPKGDLEFIQHIVLQSNCQQ